MNRQAEEKKQYNYAHTNMIINEQTHTCTSVSFLSHLFLQESPEQAPCLSHATARSKVGLCVSLCATPTTMFYLWNNNILEWFFNKLQLECVWGFITHSDLQHNPMFSQCCIFKAGQSLAQEAISHVGVFHTLKCTLLICLICFALCRWEERHSELGVPYKPKKLTCWYFGKKWVICTALVHFNCHMMSYSQRKSNYKKSLTHIYSSSLIKKNYWTQADSNFISLF